MVRFKILDNRTSIAQKIKEQERQLNNYRDFFLEGAATEVILESPVDTGTYITSHEIKAGRGSSGSSSSKGKPRNQPYEPYANEGLSSLFADIEALPEASALSMVSISNYSEHARDVEYTHGYAPYTTLRDKANVIAARAAERAKAS
jgi:hypothetical protein